MPEVKTTDGRVLAVEEWGVPAGIPVVSVCGSPMSRLARYPDPALFERLDVRLITYDRPGFGNSTPMPGRRVVDGAYDIAAIADELGLNRFGIIGVSGGGPHALAFVARFPDRVTRAAVLAGLAPRDAPGLDWTAGRCGSGTARSTRPSRPGTAGGWPSASRPPSGRYKTTPGTRGTSPRRPRSSTGWCHNA